jgi:hypothetical protein
MSSEDRALRAAFEAAQAENRRLAARVAELEAYSPEVHLARIAALEEEAQRLWKQLDMADEVRADWHPALQNLRRQLAIALEEQARIRGVMENQRAELVLNRRTATERNAGR